MDKLGSVNLRRIRNCMSQYQMKVGIVIRPPKLSCTCPYGYLPKMGSTSTILLLLH